MTKYGLLPVFGDEFSQRVKGTMRFLPTHTIPHPLGNDFLFSLVHGTSRVLREPKIRHVGQRIEIRKKDGVSRLWPHVDVSILKVGKAALLGEFAIDDHGGHAASRHVLFSVALSVAVGRIPIGFDVVSSASKILNRHEGFLPVVREVHIQRVVCVFVDPLAQRRNQIAIQRFSVFGELWFDARLHGLAGGRNLGPTLAIGRGGRV
mmetsp:Transcript_6536/g.15889  ORF Transcript_6536/g.15889 Transcript_6536/m.15889 type:complete len:206 (+) Transcript_6536:1108-1725(+)